MDSRLGRFWVIVLASIVVCATLMGAGVVQAANSPPIADAWNITSSGKAESSGEILFRVTSGSPGDPPVEVTVFVLSGSNETGVASSIRRALSTQLDRGRFDVEAGEGANVYISADRGKQGFSMELVDSDVENVRVSVSSATPVPPPTVPQQQAPANAPAIPTPSAPGDAAPPNAAPTPSAAPAAPSAPAPNPSAPPAGPSAPAETPSAPSDPSPDVTPPSNPSAPPAQPSATPDAPITPPEPSSPANGGAGAPASAPPPPPGSMH